MLYPDLQAFARQGAPTLPDGPVALCLCEDTVLIPETRDALLRRGFSAVVQMAPAFLAPNLSADHNTPVVQVAGDLGLDSAVNALSRALKNRWVFSCYNAEFLFFPFCETRSVGEMLSFHSTERRSAMLCYAVDLYAGDLAAAPDGTDLRNTWFDPGTYYAVPRRDPANGYAPLPRQLECYGGLRWRYEEHVPWERRRIDRVALFRADPDQPMTPDYGFPDPERNTVSCQWHHNLTAVIASFRTAKALRRNPGSRQAIGTFHWRGAERFHWSSDQLLDLGLMEPGQWV